MLLFALYRERPWRSVHDVFQFVVVLLSKPRHLGLVSGPNHQFKRRSHHECGFPYELFASPLGGGLWFILSATRKGYEYLLRLPEPVHEDEQFPSDRDDSTFLGILATAYCERESPAFQCGVFAELPQHEVSTLNSQLPHQIVTGFGDSELRNVFARILLPWL
jgi:hypothetical protein